MATGRSVRVSDAERDWVAAQLREHYAQGRLTLDELHQRLDLTLASKTQADLEAVTSDLPYVAPHRVLPSDETRQAHWHSASGWQPGAAPGSGLQNWAAGGYQGGYGRRQCHLGFLRVLPVLLALWIAFTLTAALGFGVAGPGPVLVFFLAALAAIRWLFGRRRWFPGPVRPQRRTRRTRPW